VIKNAQIVTPEGVCENASLQVEDGRIVEIRQGTIPATRVIDAGGNYLFPGFVDMHSDAIEKGIEPRPNTFFPVDIAAAQKAWREEQSIIARAAPVKAHAEAFAAPDETARNIAYNNVKEYIFGENA